MQTHSSDHVNHQAREWFVTMQSGAVSEAQQRAFTRWMSAAEHAAAYAEYEQVWASLGSLQHTEEGRALYASVQMPAWRLALTRWLATPWIGAGAAGIALASVLLLVILILPSEQPAPKARLYSTATAEQRAIELEDGSVITLSAKSRARVWFDERGRYVELLQGAAFFDVVSAQSMPFFVQADGLRVRVVGTQFDVHRRSTGVQVAVAEGRVRVANVATSLAQISADETGEAVDVTAGQSVAQTETGRLQVQAIEQRVAAWRSGRLEYRNARLVDVIGDANRYFDGELVLGSKSLHDARVTLALKTSQINQLPALLESSLPVKIFAEQNKRMVIIAKVQAD